MRLALILFAAMIVFALCAITDAPIVRVFTVNYTPPAKTDEASCKRTMIPGEWRCTIPTSGRTAVVYMEAYEDGSSRAYPVDPDFPTTTTTENATP